MTNTVSKKWTQWRITGAIAAGLLLGAPLFAASGKPAPSIAFDSKAVNREGRFASFAPIVKKVSASVVKVDISVAVHLTRNDEMPGMGSPMFRWFFGDESPFGGGGGNGMPQHMPRQHGIGSGVIVTGDGYILTNNHVVDGADEVKITLQDGREFTAKVIGKDPKTDVAVVKVEATNLPHLVLADSDGLEVGDVVLAVGNPFGIGQTVTSGIVSATGRNALGLEYEDFIQTDAAINPGNSGGALVDTEGRLVGINTAILSRSGGNQGIGFAIPVNMARGVMDQLVETGKVTRGYLGVRIQDVTPALARKMELKESHGALVSEVTPKSPAAKAGIESGDVIVEYDGKPVESSRQLKLAVGRAKPGETVAVRLMRDSGEKTLKIAIKELQDKDEVASADHSDANKTDVLNGVGVGDLDVRARRQFGIPEHVRGAVVTEVAADSPAHDAGLEVGDVILEINRSSVKSADDAVRLTENPKDRTTLLKIWSKGGTRFLVVDESKS